MTVKAHASGREPSPGEQQRQDKVVRLALAARGLVRQDTKITRLVGAVGLHSTVYRLQAPRGMKDCPPSGLCLKAYRFDPDARSEDLPGRREFGVVAELHAEGLEVPRPIVYLEELDGYLMEWFEGINLRRRLLPRLAWPVPSGVFRSSLALVGKLGRWLRDFQDAAERPDAAAEMKAVIDEARVALDLIDLPSESLRPRVVEMFDRYDTVPVASVRSHGEYCARNQLARFNAGSLQLCVIDWSDYGRRHRYFDLHTTTVNFLFWASAPGISLRRARRLEAAFEEGYFGSEASRDEAYWATRAAHIVRAFRDYVVVVPWFREVGERRWQAVVDVELCRCLDRTVNQRFAVR